MSPIPRTRLDALLAAALDYQQALSAAAAATGLPPISLLSHPATSISTIAAERQLQQQRRPRHRPPATSHQPPAGNPPSTAAGAPATSHRPTLSPADRASIDAAIAAALTDPPPTDHQPPTIDLAPETPEEESYEDYLDTN